MTSENGAPLPNPRFGDIYRFLRPYISGIWLYTSLVLAVESMGFLPPLVLGMIVDHIESGAPTDTTFPLLVGFVGAVLFRSVAKFFTARLRIRLRNQVAFSVQRQLFSGVFRAPLPTARESHSSYLVGRISTDTVALGDAFIDVLMNGGINGILLLEGFVIMATFHYSLAVGAAAILLSIAGLMALSEAGLVRATDRLLEVKSGAQEQITDTVQGLEDFKAHGIEESGWKRVSNMLERVRAASTFRELAGVRVGAMIELVSRLGEVGLLTLTVYHMMRHTLSVADLSRLLRCGGQRRADTAAASRAAGMCSMRCGLRGQSAAHFVGGIGCF